MKSVRFGQWGSVLALTVGAATSGCWLDRDVVDLPTSHDAASPPPSSGSGPCQWVVDSASGCSLTGVSCGLSACPPSWMQANSPGSCPQAGTGVSTEVCDGMYRWTLLSNEGFTNPGDGYLIVTCYYDMSNGLLAGIDSQSPLGCGGPKNYQYGTIPRWCHDDGGVSVQAFTCSAAGSGH